MKTTAVVESLSYYKTNVLFPENTNLLQDLFNSMRNLHLIVEKYKQKRISFDKQHETLDKEN